MEDQANLDANQGQDAQGSAAEMIKVVDRKGNVKVIPKAEYQRKKRTRKKRMGQKHTSFRETLSVVFIVIVMAIAIYLALKIVQ
ncbi:MAG: hypothetical protein NTW14_10355 [bacterium]|nr:hypothetical protein [bacterium]